MGKNFDYEGFQIASPAMIKVFNEVKDYATHAYPLIFLGPTGSGKEYLARFYHKVFCKTNPKFTDFESVNCAGFSKDTAFSELFGHVKGAFTGATADKPGIFETTNGILFLDEFGDLPPEVQSMLLRALDPNIKKGKRLGANKEYKIENVTVIAATDKPKDTIRDALLARLGAEIIVPGILERKDDVPNALRLFFSIAIKEKRVDSKNVIQKILENRSDVKKLNNPEGKIIEELASDISRLLTPAVQARDWQGNFRSVANVINQAVVRAKKINNYFDFIEDVKYHFLENCKNFSKHIYPELDSNIGNTKQNTESLVIQPEWYTNIKKVFPGFHEIAIRKMAGFFSQYGEIEFTRHDFQNYLDPNSNDRTVQLHLSELSKKSLLSVTKKGNKNYYKVQSQKTSDTKTFLKSGFLQLPSFKGILDQKNPKLIKLIDLSQNSGGIFISGKKGSGKTTLALTLGNILKKDRQVLYFSFKQGDIEHLLHDVLNELKNQSDIIELLENHPKEASLETKIAFVSGYLRSMLQSNSKPLLILDDTDLLKTQIQQNGLINIIQYWQIFNFVLSGEKMNNHSIFKKFTAVPVEQIL